MHGPPIKRDRNRSINEVQMPSRWRKGDQMKGLATGRAVEKKRGIPQGGVLGKKGGVRHCCLGGKNKTNGMGRKVESLNPDGYPRKRIKILETKKHR